VEGAQCTCPRNVADRYADRISGPLRDRIDVWVTMPRVSPGLVVSAERPESSATVAARILAARELQVRGRGRLNARLTGRALRAACRLRRDAEERAIGLAELDGLSARGTERLLRVARTIADLAGADIVTGSALEEAARFRSPTGALEQRLAV
jgi:magnesium chelatase family protein